MADQTEKPKLGTRPSLGIKRTVETGKVKQSFSHGRSNTVIVEVKKGRILGRPGRSPAGRGARARRRSAALRRRPRPRPRPAAAQALARRTRSRNRKELQQRLLREAEEARLTSLEEARRREDRTKRSADRGRASPRRRESPGRGGRCRRRASRGRGRGSPRRRSRTGRRPKSQLRLEPRRKKSRGFRRPGHAPAPKRPEPARPSRGRDEHRQRGKLTVCRALSDEDEDRARSLAALRRAREKEKRHHMETGPATKQVRDVVVPEAITVQELANRMAERGADLVKALFKMGSPVTLDAGDRPGHGRAARHRIRPQHEARQRERHRHRHVGRCRRGRDACSRGRRWSRSWATSITARRRCSTRSAAPTSLLARPAASPSISAPIRCRCPTSQRSPSSTLRATRPSPRCAPAAPTSPTS